MLQTYLDYSLNKIVGAFVKYRGSRDIIALVYVGGSGASDNSNDRELLSMEGFGEYELLWLEVFKKKITGEYRLVKPKGGTITGAYMIYKNYSTGKDTLFSPSGEVNSRCSDFIMPGPR